MSSTTEADRAVFPAEVAVVFMALGFTLTRLFVGAAVERPWLGHVGTFLAVAGVLLGWGAFGRAVVAATGRTAPGVAWVVLRLVVASPVVLLCLAAMLGEVSSTLQLVALPAAALTVLLAAGRGAGLALAGRHWLVAAALLVLAVGETCEFASFPLRYLARIGTSLARTANSLGTLGELAAFVGATLACVASVRATVRDAGPAKTAVFAALPGAVTLALMTVPFQLPRTTESMMKFGFRVRFDLLGGAVVAHPSKGALLLYTLLFSALLTASMVSLAAQHDDRGAAVRRCLGWVSVLIAGFGGAAPAGLLDPVRVTALCLGVVLLEGAAEREQQATAKAPAREEDDELPEPAVPFPGE